MSCCVGVSGARAAWYRGKSAVPADARPSQVATHGAAAQPIFAHAVGLKNPACDAPGAYADGFAWRGCRFRVAMTGLRTQPGTRGLNVASFWHTTPSITSLLPIHEKRDQLPVRNCTESSWTYDYAKKVDFGASEGLSGALEQAFWTHLRRK